MDYLVSQPPHPELNEKKLADPEKASAGPRTTASRSTRASRISSRKSRTDSSCFSLLGAVLQQAFQLVHEFLHVLEIEVN
jgi:hypothetical protein